MGKKIDLTGQRFGRLIVQYEIKERKNKRVFWHCLCDCGNEKDIQSNQLTSSHTQSCGCLQSERTSKAKIKDLQKNNFGRLTVLSQSGRTNEQRVIWECLCKCGNKINVTSHELLSGHTQSCGCLNKEKVSKRRKKNLVGKKFGKLLVLSEIKKRKKGRIFWHCICDCGKLIDVLGSSLVIGVTNSCGCLSESYIASELKKYYIKKYNAKTEYKILKNPNTLYYLPYDIYIPQGQNTKVNGIYIEINGKQHYELHRFHILQSIRKNTSPLSEFEKQKEKDEIKKNFAINNGIYVEIDLRKEKSIQEWIDYIKTFSE